MRFGADYYPEHWPETRWEEDARLMQEAGFNIVRMAEFAWCKMEPEEGAFDFSWLIKAMDILHSHGIQSIIGTPTATPPAWLCTNKPEIMRVDENRNQITFGNRQQYCVNQPVYREYTDKIVTAMAEALSEHPGLYGWQIDNEFGPMCYCEECRRAFQRWLQAKYRTLAALEEAWGTIFWSQTYTDWSQIPLPWSTSLSPSPSLALDYRRFMSDSFADYQRKQIEVVRKYSGKPITHNFMGYWPEVLNYQQLADQLDFVAWDNYPMGEADPVATSANHDVTRGYLGKNFWVMEQMSGPGGWGQMAPAPKPGRIREWTYHSIGRGADAIVYFRWRVCRSGTEQYWHGILNHDGTVNRRYAEIKQTREELKRIEDTITGTSISAEVAFLNDYDSRFALQYQKSNHALSYLTGTLSLYRGFHRRNIPVDILSTDRDLSEYKVVVAPLHFVLTEKRANLLREFVRNGGTLVMTYRSAVKTDTGLIFNEPLPGLLTDVFGASVKEYSSPAVNEVNKIKGVASDVNGMESDANVWLDLMELNGATAIAEYSDGFIPGEVAITRNEFGAGRAYYIGTQVSPEFAEALMSGVARESGIAFGVETPEGVDASLRKGEPGKFLFLVNHASQSQSVPLSTAYARELITGEAIKEAVELQPYGVAILQEKQKQ